MEETPQPADRWALLWRRVNEHKLVQWTIAYVALAYGIQHGVTLTSEAFEWPHAVERVSMLALALGLPLAVTLAWYHGHRANRHVSRAELSIISLLLVGISILFYVFARPAENVATGPASPTKTQAASLTGAPGSVAAVGISIAVLPFANVSGDAGQEFFSDGMTDEIIAALAKVPSLLVVARTSAFQFKGERKDMRTIGQALGARYLIDGSVRKAGDRVRITAQLVQADNGVGIWADSYDRELKDIFATQSDIAQAIAGALKVPLGLQQGDVLVANRAIDPDTYQQYLRARALFRARDTEIAVALLESVVARDPNFAPAWGLLARAYELEPEYRTGSLEEARRNMQSALEKAEIAAGKAIKLDSRNAVAYAALASIDARRGKFAMAEDLFKHALELDPNEPDAMQAYGSMLGATGRSKDYLAISQKILALEPLVPVYNLAVVIGMGLTGRTQETIPVLQALPQDAAGGFQRNTLLAYAYAEAGRFGEAADLLLAMRTNQVSRKSIEDAARLLRGAPTKVAAPESLPHLDGPMGFVYSYVGALDRVLEYAERNREIGANPTMTVWALKYAPLRKTARFKAYARAAGLVDYWKARGWPDLCHPVGADDFVCD